MDEQDASQEQTPNPHWAALSFPIHRRTNAVVPQAILAVRAAPHHRTECSTGLVPDRDNGAGDWNDGGVGNDGGGDWNAGGVGNEGGND